MTFGSLKGVLRIIALNTDVKINKTQRICCPKCRGRLLDMAVPEQEICRHDYRIVIDTNISSRYFIKCHKCGRIIGLSFLQN